MKTTKTLPTGMIKGTDIPALLKRERTTFQYQKQHTDFPTPHGRIKSGRGVCANYFSLKEIQQWEANRKKHGLKKGYEPKENVNIHGYTIKKVIIDTDSMPFLDIYKLMANIKQKYGACHA